MTLKQFADDAGISVFLCGPGWGGRYGWTSAAFPSCSTCGFKTKREARMNWLAGTFGERAAAAILKLMERAP